jgi:hypothetical protein
MDARLGDVRLAVSNDGAYSEGALEKGVAGGSSESWGCCALSRRVSSEGIFSPAGNGFLYFSLGMRAGGGRAVKSAPGAIA